ncbi:MAG: NADP-dependent phosphogluconate dehydrogenase [Candidatus Dormibacteraeota bacterium]|nr:NADP-dependent phosphogluconate dehydrogenase [Candidatus Dormibacteraeota bacterium]
MARRAAFGVYGLAVMGANLARNIASRGVPVALFNRTYARTEALIAAHGDEGDFIAAREVTQFVASLERPRAVLLMVKAGDPVDSAIAELVPHLERGDILIDGGNSHFQDTRRRCAEVESRGFRYLGTGISGGEEGALKGPSVMPGGTPQAYGQVEQTLTAIAAQVDGSPCCAYIGADGAGHYVKMVHNGIEYADIQLIAEAYDLMRQALGLEAPEQARIFREWNQGDLDSYLIDISAQVLDKCDPDGTPLVDRIVDEAAQKGTGKWTSQSALDLGLPLTGITEAVFARFLSAQRRQRGEAARVLAGPAGRRLGEAGLVDAIRDALYASKVVAYAQGYEQMTLAAREFGWTLDLATISSIWRGGCIIRARFLDRIRAAYSDNRELSNLLLAPYFTEATADAQASWRRVVATAVEIGVPVPAFASSLAYYDGLRRERGPANLIQGLRDYFGAHTYRRLDREGSFHTQWSQDGSEIST